MLWIILSVIAFIALLIYLFPIVLVVGDSMFPTFKNGQVLLTTRILYPYFKYTSLGEVVDKSAIGKVFIYKNPADGAIVIKRLKEIFYESGLFFQGDNSDNSYDSRHYGLVNSECVIARVIWHKKKERMILMEIKKINVSGKSPVPQLASSIVHSLETNEDVEVRAIGASAVNQMYKALSVARGTIALKGKDLLIRPGFDSIKEGEEERTVMVARIILK